MSSVTKASLAKGVALILVIAGFGFMLSAQMKHSDDQMQQLAHDLQQ